MNDMYETLFYKMTIQLCVICKYSGKNKEQIKEMLKTIVCEEVFYREYWEDINKNIDEIVEICFT